MKIESGHSFYGQNVGILVFSSESPRIPGDAGHADSFDYPVRYEVINGSFRDVISRSESIERQMTETAKRMKKLGIRGLIADCGLISLYQNEIGNILPFVGSSLIQIPLIWQMIGCKGTIGIITGHSKLLNEQHLRNSGWNESIPVAIQGMEIFSHFSEIVLNGGKNLNPELMQSEVVSAAQILLEKHSDLKAVVLECSNLATYSKKVSEETGLLVFDTISAANLLEYGLNPKTYY